MRPRLGSRGLPPEVHASWRRSVADVAGAPARILAWARSDEGYVVGSPAVLSIGTLPGPGVGTDPDTGTSTGVGANTLPGASARPESLQDTGAGSPPVWQHVGWHEIEHGGWNAESRSLSWTRYGGRRGRVGLSEPARLPELFRERVAASIVVERFVPIRGERGVTVTARRDLGGEGGLSWHSTLTRGLSWSVEGVTEEAERATAELRSEYDSASPGW